MAVSDDGAACAWRVEGSTRELFTTRFATAAAPPSQITEDGRFPDTLDEVGVVGFVTPGALVIAVGESQDAPDQGLECFDLFTVTISDGGTTHTVGLSRSTGEVSEPFLEDPELKPEEQVYWLPNEGAFLFHDEEAEEIVVTRLGQPGLSTVDADVKDLDFFEPIGDDYLAAIRRRSGNKPWQILRLAADLTQATVVHPGSSESRYVAPLRRAIGPDVVAWVWSVAGEDVAFQRMRPGMGTVESTRPTPPHGSTMGFSPSGGIALAARAGYFVWHDDGSLVRLNAPLVRGLVLAGP
jgi:hypothetical protein